jgi:hypothetical protein
MAKRPVTILRCTILVKIKERKYFQVLHGGEKMKNLQENPFFASMPQLSGPAVPEGTLPLSHPLHGDR